jgi:hypothetical protein
MQAAPGADSAAAMRTVAARVAEHCKRMMPLEELESLARHDTDGII